MENERLEDIPRFGASHFERVRIYGQHLQRKLQAENPQRNLIRKLTPEYAHVGNDTWVLSSTSYLIGEEVNIPRTGWRTMLPGNSDRKLKALVRLNTNSAQHFATIYEPSFRDSIVRIIEEQDGLSNETYSLQTTYSNEDNILRI